MCSRVDGPANVDATERRAGTVGPGLFQYLGHQLGGRFGPICRLTYTGDMQHWDFAIYKFSDECYDPDEWMFTGAEEVDGTIEGAMRAGLKAYPT